MSNDEIIDIEPTHETGLTLFRTDDPVSVIAAASAVATPLADLIRKQKLATRISGRDHVRIEGWTLLGSMLGVFPVTVWSREIGDGWEARVEARTRAGEVVGAAEAMCTRAEKTWSNRDSYALRSMAQTRAASKAMRMPLGFIMSLAGFDPTPAEEMPHDGSGAGENGTVEAKFEAERPPVARKASDPYTAHKQAALAAIQTAYPDLPADEQKRLTKQHWAEGLDMAGENPEPGKVAAMVLALVKLGLEWKPGEEPFDSGTPSV